MKRVGAAAEVMEQLAHFEAQLRLLETKRGALPAETLHTIALEYQELCQLYGYLTTFYSETTDSLEAARLVQYGRRVIYGRRLQTAKDERQSFFKRVPGAFHIVRGHCIFSLVIGVLSGVIAAFLVWLNPQLGWSMLSEDAVANLSQGKMWTEGVQGMSALASSQIATNNIGVAFSAFALGIAGGVLTIVVLIVNGASLGGIFMVVGQYNMAHRLLDFVIAHGILELSVIFVAGGCGLYLGDALISPGKLSRRAALQQRARPALDVVLFSALCLIPAGLVEGYVSPYEFIPFTVKLALGLLLGTAYWTFLLFGYRSQLNRATSGEDR